LGSFPIVFSSHSSALYEEKKGGYIPFLFILFYIIETAMLLPATFGASRRMNDSHDIRKNLRFRNAELMAQHQEPGTQKE